MTDIRPNFPVSVIQSAAMGRIRSIPSEWLVVNPRAKRMSAKPTGGLMSWVPELGIVDCGLREATGASPTDGVE
ncbi:MAG: hypothetical protein AVDCRST_MAG87-1138 [uncultured Thermomicrobiales bacterium]|uniref:Uncharacterized protein n=1 Tax=uncultured Thermomicrobiales bacterium TaxID=1645740 RepID=A0A6J4UMR2_9BACT|nr:MAG: hypothetical protein AVDCRST_MAG87-1138 [uncultured Thermomicrobiales bacterium]